MAQLHDIQPNTSQKSKKRVGRGGRRGKTSGRGHKGQKARAGGTPRPQIRDIIKKIPKLRGHGRNRSKTVNDSRTKPVVINLKDLDAFKSGDIVNPEALIEKGIVKKKRGRIPDIKILGDGEVKKKLTISDHFTLSESAREAIEKAGGSIA
ncbi:MAG: 50S ribosomal protein L15 [Candidatus Paceibacterota bacterium]